MKPIIPWIVAGVLVMPAFAAETPAQTAAKQSAAAYQEGVAAEKAGDVGAAQLAYTKAIKLDSNNAQARFSLGQLRITGPEVAAKGREAKFGTVMIPLVQFDQAPFQEALEAFSKMVEKESKEQVTPNFVIQDPKGELAARKVSLNLKNMPSRAVLKYLLDQTNSKAKYDEHAIVIVAN